MLFRSSAIILSDDIFNLYVFFEIAAIAQVGIIIASKIKGNYETALKYMILGSIASPLLLVGIALLLGVTGNVNVTGVVSNGPLSLVNNSIRSSTGFVSPGTGHNIGILQLSTPSHYVQLKRYWDDPAEQIELQYGVTNGITSLLDSKYSSRGTTSNPLVVQEGDALSLQRTYGYDGYDYVLSSSI